MRTHAQSWIAKLILWAIVLSFGLWGIGDYFLGSRVETVASVDGEPIHDPEFAQAYERATNRYRVMLGKQFSKELMERLHVRENTLQTLINRRLILIEAGKLGLVTPDSAVLNEVEHNPNFLTNGSFDPARYRIMTRNMGFRSPQEYESQLKVDLLALSLERGIMDSAPVSEADIRADFDRQFEKRVIAAVVVDPASFEKKISVSDADVRAYYDAHKDDYRSPLRLKMLAVDISPEEVAKGISVDDAELHKVYEKNLSAYMQPEQRRARHILIRVSPTASKTVLAAARKRIEAIQARLKAGVDFAKLAKKYSEDSTAAQGGDLGYFTKGTMVAAFDKAVFSMKPGQISDIIETPFGYHLIQLEDIKPAAPKPFADVKDKIREDLIQQKAKDEAYKLSEDLDDALGRMPELKDAAASLNLPVQEIGPVSAQEAMNNKLLTSDPELRAKASAMKPGDPVDVLDLANGHYAAVEVTQRLEPAVLPFEQVAARVRADAEQAAADKMARDTADKLLREGAGKTVDQIAQASGQPKFLSKPVRSNGLGDDASWLTSEVRDAAFSTPKGQWADHVIEVPNGLALVRVEDVIAPDQGEYAKERDAITLDVARSMGAVRFARWMASVRARHSIKVNTQALDRF
ncbi:MAG TPA: peptidyl-prolyl cis-trans isomerase [Mariprofundaceae bacterium]|nr:peptidyl-prolyl cis-trans isomerase [Mariprofundaceae bacterium]